MISNRNRSSNNYSKLLCYVGGLIAVSAWGGSFISTKVLLVSGLNAVEIYLYRFLIAYILTLICCPKPFFCHSWQDEFRMLLCGLCGGSIYFISENTSVNYTLVTNVSLITSTSPLITMFLLGIFYKSQRPGRSLIIGSTVSFLGVACVIFNSSFVVKLNPLGDLLALLSAICWSLYTIVLRPLSATYSTWFVSRKTFFYGLLTALPFLIFEPGIASWSILKQPEVWGNLLFLGMIASMAAYLLWGLIVNRLGPVTSSNFLYIIPLVTLILSVTLLHENISWIGYVGCLLIISGLMLSDILERKKIKSDNDSKRC